MLRSLISTMPLKKNGQLIIRTISNIPKPNTKASNSNDENNKLERPWQPTKRVSRATMEKIRSLAAMYPGHYNSVSLATEFRISPEAVKRILKSKFRPEPVIADRQEKNRYAAMGIRKQQIQSKSITFSEKTPSSSSSGMTSSAMTPRKHFGKRHHPSSSLPTTNSSWKRD